MIFKDDDEFTRFKPRDNRGRPMNVGGYFRTQPDANFIVFTSAGQEFDDFTVFHEYTHYLLYRTGRRLPGWMEEGVAEFYSTFTRRYQGKTVVGRPRADRLSSLKDRTFIPLRTIISPSSSELDKMWRTPSYISQYYAECWALTHYLIIQRKVTFSRYLDALSSGRPPDDAFREGFGVDVETADQELRDYSRRLLFSAIAYPAFDDGSKAVATSRMREADVHQLFGRLLLDRGAFDEADREVQAALMLDEADVNARVGLARLRMSQGRTDDAIAILEAVSKGVPSSLDGAERLGAGPGPRLAGERSTAAGPACRIRSGALSHSRPRRVCDGPRSRSRRCNAKLPRTNRPARGIRPIRRVSGRARLFASRQGQRGRQDPAVGSGCHRSQDMAERGCSVPSRANDRRTTPDGRT